MITIQSVRQDAGIHWYEQNVTGVPVWTLILASYGKCMYWIGKEKTMLEKGDLLLIPQGIPFYGKSIPSVTHEKYVVTFNKDEGEREHQLPLLSADRVCRGKTGKYELLLQRFRLMHEEWRGQPRYAGAMCRALALEVLTHWNRERDEGRTPTVKERHAEQMKAYIQNHYREKVTKEELGDVIGKSPNYAASVFSDVTGLTIGGYVHALRVKTAVYLLSHSQRTVGDISDYLGYCDASYFHRVFKRETGKPPAAYVKEREEPVL